MRPEDETEREPPVWDDGAMSRWRLARIAGAVLVLGTLICGCGLLAVLEPQPPWYDVEAQQAEWNAFFERALVIGGVLVLTGVALGVAGAVGEAVSAGERDD